MKITDRENVKIILIILFPILFGILLLFLGYHQHGLLSLVLFVAGISSLLLGLFFLSNVLESNIISDYPDYKSDIIDKERGKYGIFIEYFLYFFCSTSMLVLALGGKACENTIGGTSLLFKLIPLSVLIVVLLYLLLKRLFPKLFIKKEKREKLIFCALLTITFYICLMPFYFNKMNLSKYTEEKFKLKSFGKNYKYGTKYIHVFVSNKVERIEMNNQDYKLLTPDMDSVVLYVGKGRLGYFYVNGLAAK